MLARLLTLFALLASVACSTVPPLPPKAIELNRDGAAALAAGDLATAEARLSVAIEYSPRFTEAWVNLGYVEMRRGTSSFRTSTSRRHAASTRTCPLRTTRSGSSPTAATGRRRPRGTTALR